MVQADQAFDIFDYNRNGILSLAEIDKAVIETLPQFAKDKPAIMRTYHAIDKNQDGFINKREFQTLIKTLEYYDDLFQHMDTNSDHRISYAEFRRGHDDLGLHVSSDDDLKRIFAAIDSNHGGMILFNEFCLFMAKLLYHRNNQ